MSLNILFVVPYTPNLIRVRPYNLIRSLSANGNRVHVLTLWSNDSEREDALKLESIAEKVFAFPLPRWRSMLNCLWALPTAEPLQAAYCWQPEAAKDLLKMTNGAGTESYDVVHIEHLRGVRYGLSLKSELRRASRAAGVPVVWDSVDSISHLFRQASEKSENPISRLWTRFELARTERHEGRMVGAFDRVLVTSPTDKNVFKELSGLSGNDIDARISVLSNGVDLKYFKLPEDASFDENMLIVTGKMSYHANVAMVMHLMEHVMPIIWSEKPDVKLWVVGKDPARDILAFKEHPGVRITGTVPDLRPYLHRAALALAPLTYGAGIQNKVLEAMACGTPVITYPDVISSLGVNPEEDLILARSPQEMANAALSVLGDRQKRNRIGVAGRRYVEQHHDWEKIAGRLEMIYTECID